MIELDGEASSYRVGLAFNLKKGIQGSVEDIEAEYDSIDTVMAIKNALEATGCQVELMEADHTFLDKLKRTKVDIVFNIAEGLGGRGREAHVPAILSFLGIPFTGSDETTLCIALDKALTKRLLTSFRILTPKHQLISYQGERIRRDLKFPIIVKPNAEGSSKGISSMAVVDNMEQLKVLLERNFRLYSQPMLIEEFIPGREFTVGVIGNGPETRVFTPMEIVYKEDRNGRNIYSFDVKKDYKKYVEYVCPPDLSLELQRELMDIAGKVYRALQCRDFARMDFRMSKDNRFYFIEINPLPGLAPGYSDYPMIAEFCGVEYNTLIKMILNSALKRYGMAPVM
ncbi:D-alanine-D-alanine ligase [Caldicoprobacter guelmensis]|uniref:D-alanine--D-alanine ligase family protein n=1 Tax=Caldicoprobacter guelmensis TaxID=1170224 RepID=UPI00311C8B86|nr:D-alanine-D-alanine ligase [Caldicoprobacter guelmensis]